MNPTQSQADQEDDLRIIFGLMEEGTELKNAALEDLLQKHGGAVKAMVLSKFGTQLQQDEIHDVLIRTATKAWNYAKSFNDEKASLQTWLVTIALNEALDVLRENTTDCERVADGDFVEPSLKVSDDVIAEGKLKKDSKLFDDLDIVIAGLPDLQRAIIQADLRCGGTADAERLAAIHGTSKNSIYVSRTKAKKNIETKLRSMGHYKFD